MIPPDSLSALSIKKSEWFSSPPVQSVFELLRKGGGEGRVVGGAVRNHALQLPVNDIDIATDLLPDEVVELARKNRIKCIPTGVEHGTVTLLVENMSIEVTTLRQDVVTDGRHAKVVFGHNWKLDAERRDFTINAIYVDDRGNIHDPVNGIKDLINLSLRFIGNASVRIEEDYLRILRFFRFLSQYPDLKAEKKDFEACQLQRDGISQLSAERIGQEMRKLLTGSNAAVILTSMQEYRVLELIFGRQVELKSLNLWQVWEQHLFRAPAFEQRLAQLCSQGKHDIDRLFQSWRLSTAERDHLTALLGQANPASVSHLEFKTLLYRNGAEFVRDAILVGAVQSASLPPNSNISRFWQMTRDWNSPKFPVSGKDLIAINICPGPEMGRLIARLQTQWIASDFQLSQADLLARIKD